MACQQNIYENTIYISIQLTYLFNYFWVLVIIFVSFYCFYFWRILSLYYIAILSYVFLCIIIFFYWSLIHFHFIVLGWHQLFLLSLNRLIYMESFNMFVRVMHITHTTNKACRAQYEWIHWQVVLYQESCPFERILKFLLWCFLGTLLKFKWCTYH